MNLKHRLLGLSLVILSTSALADVQQTNTAAQFAAQAGAIAGSAQACGQNIVTLNQRVLEVIHTLTTQPADQQAALMVYEKVVTDAAHNQKMNSTMNCSDVLLAYNSLPLLKSDYKKTVMPEMAKLANK